MNSVLLGAIYVFTATSIATVGVLDYINNKGNLPGKRLMITGMSYLLWGISLAFMMLSSNIKDVAFFHDLSLLAFGLTISNFYVTLIFINDKHKIIKSGLLYSSLSNIFPFIYFFISRVFYPSLTGGYKLASFGWVAIYDLTSSNTVDLLFVVYIIICTLGCCWENYKYYFSKESKNAGIVVLIGVAGVSSLTLITVYTEGFHYLSNKYYSIPPVTFFLSLIPVIFVFYTIKYNTISSFFRKTLIFGVLREVREAIVVTDMSSKIRFANFKFLELFNLTRQFAVNSNISEIYDNYSLLPSEGETSSVTDIEINGNFMRVKSVPIYNKLSGHIGYYGIFTNITSLKNVNKSLNEVNEQLSSIITMKSELLEDNIETLINADFEHEKLKIELDSLMSFDSLTGFLNTASFKKEVHRILTDYPNESHAMVYLDLSLFKKLSARQEKMHLETTLSQIAKRLYNCIDRKNPIMRIGKDNFAILLVNMEDENAINEEVSKLFNISQVPIVITDETITLDAKAGVAVYPNDGLTYDELIKKADMANHESKDRITGSVGFFSKEIENKMDFEYLQRENFIKAIEYSEFVTRYIPIIKSENGERKIIGVEAITLWLNPEDGGLVDPTFMFPLAEGYGEASTLVEWLISTACTEFVASSTENRTGLYIRVPFNKLDYEELHESVKSSLEESKLSPQLLTLEFSEKIFVNGVNPAINMIKDLKRLGVCVTLYDFGSEYSSLSHFKDYPIDGIKLSSVFIENVGKTHVDNSIVNMLVALGKDIGLSVIAEGVYDIHQDEYLNSIDCELRQGNYYYRAMSLTDLKKIILQRD